jgi:microcystin-dependent protein
MSNPYVGEIRIFAGTFAPVGWSFCAGQLQSIAENDTLFSLIGTTYGGDGTNTFALPNLQSRVPIHQGPGYVIGQTGGVETVTLTVAQIPSHAHQGLGTSDPGTTADPTGSVWASSPQLAYGELPAPEVTLAPDDVSSVGGSQPHDNMLPYLGLNFIISLFGIYPIQN